MNEDEAFFDLFTPVNVLTGAIARYRGAQLPTVILLGTGIELLERVLLHHFGEYLPHAGGPKQPGCNLAVGLLATAFGWVVTDCILEGSDASRS